MIVYLHQCYPLNLSHPLLLPLCPQVCPLHLNLCSFPANRFISTIFSTIFLMRFVHTNQWKRNQIYENKTLPLIECIPPGSSVHGIFQARGTGVVKNLPAMQETSSIPGLGRSPEDCHGQRTLVGYSPWGLKSRTRLSDKTTTSSIHKVWALLSLSHV